MTTTLVEQFHVSGAQITHRHPGLEHNALVCRMTVYHFRALFYPCLFDNQGAKLNSLLGDIARQIANTKHTGIKQAYTKLLVSHAKALAAAGGPSQHAVRRLF